MTIYSRALIVFALLLFSFAFAEDKQPRSRDKINEAPQNEPSSKIDKIKRELKKNRQSSKSSADEGDDDIWADLALRILSHTIPEGFSFSYSPYPYYGRGLFIRETPATMPVFIRSYLSTFNGFNEIRSTHLGLKLKFFTGVGLNYEYAGISQDILSYESNLKMHTCAAVLNIITNERGSFELEFGARRIIDIGTGGTIGIEFELAPHNPIIVHSRINLAKINGNNTNDFLIGIGYNIKQLEIFAGYRQFNLANAVLRGPELGLILRL